MLSWSDKTWAAMDINKKVLVFHIFRKKLGWSPQGTDKRVNTWINEQRKKWNKANRKQRAAVAVAAPPAPPARRT